MTILKPRLVDFHCHLDLYPDLSEAIKACDAARSATLAVTTTPKAFRHNVQLASKSEFVRVGLGLHPQLVQERWNEFALFEALLPETRYVGEVGLDAGPQFYRSFERQTEVFRKILVACAHQRNKILSVHSVRSVTKILDHVEELLPRDSGKVVLHWFTGTASEAARAAALGCYFSVNQAMFRSEKGLALVRKLPLDRILTETDGPFVESHGKPVGAGNVEEAIMSLASVFGSTPEEMRKVVVRNLKSLVSD